MEKKFITVTIGIDDKKSTVASCYKEEIVPLKYDVTMEGIKADIKKNLSKKLYTLTADKVKLPDSYYVIVTVENTNLIDENWSILDQFYGKTSIKDSFVMDSEFIEKISNAIAERITDKIYHFVPKTKTFKVS